MSQENDTEHRSHANPCFEPDSTDVEGTIAATEQSDQVAVTDKETGHLDHENNQGRDVKIASNVPSQNDLAKESGVAHSLGDDVTKDSGKKEGTNTGVKSPKNITENTEQVNPCFESDSTDIEGLTVETEQEQENLGTPQASCLGRTVNIFGLRIFKACPLIIMLCIQVYLFAVPFATWLLFTIPNAQAKGLSDLSSAQISIAGGVANFFGRFASGFLLSKNLLPVEIWFLVVNIFASAAFFVNYFADSFWFLTILAVVFGYTMGFGITALIVHLKKISGNEYYNTGLSVTGACYGTAFPLAGYIAGKIYDDTQSYNIAFFVMGGMSLAAGLAAILPLLCSRVYRKYRESANNHA